MKILQSKYGRNGYCNGQIYRLYNESGNKRKLQTIA